MASGRLGKIERLRIGVVFINRRNYPMGVLRSGGIPLKPLYYRQDFRMSV